MDVNIIHNCDCQEFIKNMPDKSVDITITDPPYGMSYVSNYRRSKHKKIIGDDCFPEWLLAELFRVTRNAVYVFCRWDNLVSIPKPKSFLCWVKNNWSCGDLKHEHGRMWEGIAFYQLDGHSFIKRIPDVIKCSRTKNNIHPTQKPLELICTIIAANCGQVVFDPFMGSGTTAEAAKQLHRDYIGCEIDTEYVSIANGRLAQGLLF